MTFTYNSVEIFSGTNTGLSWRFTLCVCVFGHFVQHAFSCGPGSWRLSGGLAGSNPTRRDQVTMLALQGHEALALHGRKSLGVWLHLAGWNTTKGSGMRVLSVALLQTGDATGRIVNPFQNQEETAA